MVISSSKSRSAQLPIVKSLHDLLFRVPQALPIKRKGYALDESVRATAPELNEAEFADNFIRYLSRRKFLLLIVGDGIREGGENVVDNALARIES